MTGAFDPRIVIVGIQVEGSDFVYFQDEDIRIKGQKFAGPNSNACTIKISNLTRAHVNTILTKATPLSIAKNPPIMPINVTVDVGRVSKGVFRLFQGQCYVSNVTQPPDISVTLRSLVQNFQAGIIAELSMGPITQLQTIAQNIATANNLKLDITNATPRQISNFSRTGSLNKDIQKLQLLGGIRVYVDNDTLYVTDADKLRPGSVFQLNSQTGMVGVPQASESGFTAQCLVQAGINVGGGIAITSQINPEVNGVTLGISQLTFDIANRDNPFFYTMFCSNQAWNQGTS